jgi:hypothetical protein
MRNVHQSTRLPGRRLRLLSASVAVLVAAVFPAPQASAEDFRMPLTRLGADDVVSLPDTSGVDLVLPVPAGVTPDELTGTIDVGDSGIDTRLVISGENGPISSVDFDSRPGQSKPFTVDVGEVPVIDHAFRATLRVVRKTGVCPRPEATATQVRELSLIYSGRPSAPTAIADFLPPVLTGLTIAVPDEPSAEVGSAAVRLASAVAARYAPASPPIDIVASSRGPSSATGLNRTITLTGDGEAGIQLDSDPRGLTVAGAGDDVTAQISALTSDLASISVTNRAAAAGRPPVPELPPRTQNLDQLGIGSPTSTGNGSATVHLGIDSARTAGLADGWNLRLVGTAMTSAVPDGNGRQDQRIVRPDRTRSG